MEKNIISQEAQIESLFLVPNPMLMPLFTYGQQIILIQEVFSSQEKLKGLSHFDIADYVINILFIMSMRVMIMLHGILMMVIHSMLVPLIYEFTPEVTTVLTIITFPYLSSLHKSHNTSISLKNMLLKIRNYFKIPWIWRKILILLFVWSAQWPKHLPLLEACFPPI